MVNWKAEFFIKSSLWIAPENAVRQQIKYVCKLRHFRLQVHLIMSEMKWNSKGF